MTVRFFLVCLVVSLCLMACRSHPKPSAVNNTADMPVDSAQIDSVESRIYLMLSPNEILNEIFSAKVVFTPQLLNPKESAAKYLDLKQRALGLGVYIADFAYLNLCRNKSNTLDYFRIIRDLAQKINVYGCFDEATFERIQDNLANSDSLVGISEEMYYNMTEILENANQQNVDALITGGALVESLYLSVMSIDKMADRKGLEQKIIEQKPLFDDFYAFISTYKKDKDVKEVVVQMEKIKKVLDQFGVVSQQRKITRDRRNHLNVKGGQDIVIDEATFAKFKTTVVEIRHIFINVN